MLFTKEENKKYTAMCKEFDEEFYSGHRDDTKLFGYMFLVYHMLANKGNFFREVSRGSDDMSDYDKYALYASNIVYTRYIKNEKKGIHYKSLLNYAKSTKNTLRIDYQNKEWQQVTKEGDEDVVAYTQIYRQFIQNACSNQNVEEDIEETLQSITATLKETIDETPYRHDKLLRKNLYISALLTMLNASTLRKSVYEKAESRMASGASVDDYLMRQFKREREEPPMLWNLDESFKDTVQLVVNKTRAKISTVINEISSSKALPDDIIDAIISSTIKETLNTDDLWDNSNYAKE